MTHPANGEGQLDEQNCDSDCTHGANNDGCQLRGTAKWEGKELVNSWEEKVDGKTARFKDSFVDISPSSFRLVSEGSADGKTIWRVITIYEKVPGSSQ